MKRRSSQQFRSIPISRIVRVVRIVKTARGGRKKAIVAKLRYDEDSL